MSIALFPSSMIAILNKPLDGKTNVLSIEERNQIPLSQRYKGMMLVVQNPNDARPQLFWLPTDDLSNAGWEEIKFGDEPSSSSDEISQLRDEIIGLRNSIEGHCHIQPEPQIFWEIAHGFDSYYVDVRAWDEYGNVLLTIPTAVNGNVTRLDWQKPVAGYAILRKISKI